MFLADTRDNIPFELIGSNISQIATFGSTTDSAMIQIYSNDPFSNMGFLIGTSNIDSNNSAFNIGQISSDNGIASCNIYLINNQIGINTTLPNATLDINGTLQVLNTLWAGADGNVGIGTLFPNYKLQVEGKIFATDTITAFSDISMKKNVATIQSALDKVKSLRGVRYNRIDTEELQIGVIAQEVKEVVPEVVTSTSQGLSVAYGNMVGILIEAIKEMSIEIEKLKAQNQASTSQHSPSPNKSFFSWLKQPYGC